MVIWANGVGPLTSDSARNLTRIAFQTARHVSVRDAESAALLEAIGVAGRPIVAPDPIFCLPAANADAGPPLQPNYNTTRAEWLFP
ncbi:MAG: polysaccharide pyruvyl transferase family protein [Chloroflexi bacterium]|nr:polysaccharide pyruvyl transferase family protein [Chloroflexota bacterium]